uniref:Uncharacterized protein n=1 Tax=Entomoneis paludosa TaxID=265537 RepID=A0A7S2YJK9_9STRA
MTNALISFEQVVRLQYKLCSATNNTMHRSIKEVFLDPRCNIRDLSLTNYPDHGIDQAGFDELCIGLRGYDKLRKLSLSSQSVFPLQNLCPRSRLEELRLEVSDWQSVSDLIHQQQHLVSMDLTCNVDSSQVSLEESFVTFSTELRDHMSLRKVKLRFRRHGQIPLCRHLFDALVGNTILRTLDLSECVISIKDLVEGIPKVNRLQELFLSMHHMPSREMEQVISALEKNVGVCCVQKELSPSWRMKNRRIFCPSAIRNVDLVRVLSRNQLVHFAHEIPDELPGIPSSLWPHVIAKFGKHGLSVGGESTPLFSFMRAGAEFLGGSLAPSSKKRKAANTG